jgi:hypothetical protein
LDLGRLDTPIVWRLSPPLLLLVDGMMATCVEDGLLLLLLLPDEKWPLEEEEESPLKLLLFAMLGGGTVGEYRLVMGRRKGSITGGQRQRNYNKYSLKKRQCFDVCCFCV